MEIYGNLRIKAEEIRKQGRHPAQPERHRHGQADQAARAAGHLARRILRSFGLAVDARGALRQRMADFRQGEPAGSAVEQPGAEPILEPADRPRDGGDRHAQGAGGTGEGAFLRHLGEHRQSFEIWELRHRQICNDEFQPFLFQRDATVHTFEGMQNAPNADKEIPDVSQARW